MPSCPDLLIPRCPDPWTYRRLLQSPSREPSSTEWRRERKKSFPTPCLSPWQRAGAAVRSRSLSARMPPCCKGGQVTSKWQVRRTRRREHSSDSPRKFGSNNRMARKERELCCVFMDRLSYE